jgi:hypothetical protein
MTTVVIPNAAYLSAPTRNGGSSDEGTAVNQSLRNTTTAFSTVAQSSTERKTKFPLTVYMPILTLFSVDGMNPPVVSEHPGHTLELHISRLGSRA